MTVRIKVVCDSNNVGPSCSQNQDQQKCFRDAVKRKVTKQIVSELSNSKHIDQIEEQFDWSNLGPASYFTPSRYIDGGLVTRAGRSYQSGRSLARGRGERWLSSAGGSLAADRSAKRSHACYP
jgi:hypothetical protein